MAKPTAIQTLVTTKPTGKIRRLTPGRTNATVPALSSAVTFWTARDAVPNDDKTTSLEKIPFTNAASLEDTFVVTVFPVASVAESVKIGMIKGSIFCLRPELAT